MTVKNALCKAFFVLFVPLFCIALSISSAQAAELEDGTAAQGYGIEFTLRFSDDGEHDLADYLENAFLIQDEASSAYLMAEYYPDGRYYLLTGATESEDAATRFTCGHVETDPGFVAIYGFEKGAYVMRQAEVTDGYTLLKDGINLSFFNGDAQLNKETLNYENGTADSEYAVISFGIVVTKGFELPATCYACLIRRHPIILVWDVLFLGAFIAVVVLLIVGLIKIFKEGKVTDTIA